MPRLSAHLVKSAIRLERQSTTVPNTSNTSAFTAEISDMRTPLLHGPSVVGQLVVGNARLRIAGLRQPVHPAGACRLCLVIHGLERPPRPEPRPRALSATNRSRS